MTKNKDKFTPKLADIISRNFKDPNTKLIIQVKNRIFFVGPLRELRKTYERLCYTIVLTLKFNRFVSSEHLIA